jgi:NTP pyrophosphatase (non-canonical NTP hydrolase)
MKDFPVFPRSGLTFDQLRAANEERLPLFKDRTGKVCHEAPDGSDWTPAEWITAIMGELGELAGELKKTRRGDYGSEPWFVLRYPNECHPSEMPDEVKKKIASEIADVAIYLDLFTRQFGIDLGEAVRDKFNEVSDRVGVEVKL